MAIWPRRAGKDICALNIMLRAALRQIGNYFYLLPTGVQARRTVFEGMTIDGMQFLDYIPAELIEKKNIAEMKITLINGSQIQFAGSDSYDRLMGISANGIIFSEYALQDPRAYSYLRPALTAADAWALFISTPRGHNHLYTMYQVAKESPEWFCSHLTVEGTKHISLFDIQKEIALGEISEDLAKQEYYTSFDMGIQGSYYMKYIDRLRLNNQITDVPWEPSHPVYSSWDIGVRDSTSIIMFQVIGQTVRILNVYEKNKEGLEHYINFIKSQPYTYAKHFAPHDMKQMEFGSGMTRWAKAYDLGVNFTVVDNIPIVDGIEVVRSVLPRCWFNEATTRPLVRALENYRQEFDTKHNVYKGSPVHDQYSHFADSFRYLSMGLRHAQKGTSAEDLERRYHEATYGDQQFTGFFRQ